ncbi:hypothetical protein B0H67DRAFT_476097, partial [Lasiosphaeris hirsuta]
DVRSMIEGGWSSDDRTFFKGVGKIFPGNWMEVTPEGKMERQLYWDLEYKDKVRVVMLEPLWMQRD